MEGCKADAWPGMLGQSVLPCCSKAHTWWLAVSISQAPVLLPLDRLLHSHMFFHRGFRQGSPSSSCARAAFRKGCSWLASGDHRACGLWLHPRSWSATFTASSKVSSLCCKQSCRPATLSCDMPLLVQPCSDSSCCFSLAAGQGLNGDHLQDGLGGEVKRSSCTVCSVDPVHSLLAVSILSPASLASAASLHCGSSC